MWLQVINKVKVTHQGEDHIKVKVKISSWLVRVRQYGSTEFFFAQSVRKEKVGFSQRKWNWEENYD